jgi:hypothetical protein
MMQTTSIVTKTFIVLEEVDGMGVSYNRRSQKGVNLFITFNKETHQIMCDFEKHQIAYKFKHLVHCLIQIPCPSQAKQTNFFKNPKEIIKTTIDYTQQQTCQMEVHLVDGGKYLYEPLVAKNRTFS